MDGISTPMLVLDGAPGSSFSDTGCLYPETSPPEAGSNRAEFQFAWRFLFRQADLLADRVKQTGIEDQSCDTSHHETTLLSSPSNHSAGLHLDAQRRRDLHS